MSYREVNVPRDTRLLQQAALTKGVSGGFVKGIKAAGERERQNQKELKDLRTKASASVQGYYDKIADYEKTGNQSIDKQVIQQLTDAAKRESKLYMQAYGNEGTDEDMIAFQTAKATNNKDLDDLTMFIGTFDNEMDDVANVVAQDPNNVIGLKPDTFDFQLAIQNNASVPKVTKGFIDKNGDFIETSSITDPTDPNYGRGSFSLVGTKGSHAGKVVDLEEWNTTMKDNGGKYYKIKDNEYNLIASDYLDKENEKILKGLGEGINVKAKSGKPTTKKTGVSTTTAKPGTSYTSIPRNTWVELLKNSLPKADKKGKMGALSKDGGTLDQEQLYYMMNPTATAATYDAWKVAGNTDDLYKEYANWYIDQTYPGFEGADFIQINKTFSQIDPSTVTNVPKITQ